MRAEIHFAREKALPVFPGSAGGGLNYFSSPSDSRTGTVTNRL